MATEKAPTKAEFLEALKEKGINSLEDLVDAIMPETGGYADDITRSSLEMGSSGSHVLAKQLGLTYGPAHDAGRRGPLYGIF